LSIFNTLISQRIDLVKNNIEKIKTEVER